MKSSTTSHDRRVTHNTRSCTTSYYRRVMSYITRPMTVMSYIPRPMTVVSYIARPMTVVSYMHLPGGSAAVVIVLLGGGGRRAFPPGARAAPCIPLAPAAPIFPRRLLPPGAAFFAMGRAARLLRSPGSSSAAAPRIFLPGVASWHCVSSCHGCRNELH